METVNSRSFKMLCPMCQRVDEVTSAITVYDQNRYIAADVMLFCPTCHCEMYEADELMIPILSKLNKVNIRTHASCACLHNGVVDPLYTERRDDNTKMHRGPYIIFSKLPVSHIGTLYALMQQSKQGLIFDTDRVTMVINPENIDYPKMRLTTLEMELAEPTRENVEYALEALEVVCDKWINVLRNTNELDLSRRATIAMRHIKIPNYGQDDPNLRDSDPSYDPKSKSSEKNATE